MKDMTITAGPGDKVRFFFIDAGRDDDIEHAISHNLQFDKVYTITRVVVHKYTTRVWLDGISTPVGFNSVLFVDEQIDRVASAARRAYYTDQERRTGLPYDTDKINIKDTIYGIRALVKGIIFNDPMYDVRDNESYDIGIMLMSALVVGPYLPALIEFTDLLAEDLAYYFHMAMQFNIFTDDDKIACAWFERDGAMAFLSDIWCIQGVPHKQLRNGGVVL